MDHTQKTGALEEGDIAAALRVNERRVYRWWSVYRNRGGRVYASNHVYHAGSGGHLRER